MEPTDRWIHFTSDANMQHINKHGSVKLGGNMLGSSSVGGTRHDGILTDQYAPHGVWFNCNFYRSNLLTRTVYPERCNTITVPGLVVTVADLLAGHRWALFEISDVPDAYRQVKYACVVSGGPEEAWLQKRGLVHVYNQDGDNKDGFVKLHWSNSRERYTWKAVDAQHKIL